MRIKPANKFLLINVISIILIVIIAFLPSNPLRIVFGLPFILFIPGYLLISALFPKQTELGNLKRIALSFGLSVAIAVLIGLILNYTPWNLALYPILAAVAIFLFVTSVIAWQRQRKISGDRYVSDKTRIELAKWKTISIWNKALFMSLLVLVLGSVGTLAYAIVTPKEGEEYTEFYILAMNGQAEDYPTELNIGETGQVILGITNHEGDDSIAYSVELSIDGDLKEKITPITLDNENQWEGEVSFVADKIGENQKVEFSLYKQEDDAPYKILYLWIDVREP